MTVAGPAIAAIAAVASWAAVVQARRLAREEKSPLLMVQKIITDKTIGVVLTNAGGGAARGVSVLLSYPPYGFEESIGTGFLFPGQTRVLRSNIRVEGEGIETDVMAFCRDRDGFPHFWNAEEKHKVFKTRFRRRPEYGHALRDVFREMHPQVDFDELQHVRAMVFDPDLERRAS